MNCIFNWRVEANSLMKKVSMMGVIIEAHEVSSRPRLLLQNALEMIEIADYFGGIVIPSEPPQKDREFVYFEIIFGDDADYTGFLEIVRNKSS